MRSELKGYARCEEKLRTRDILKQNRLKIRRKKVRLNMDKLQGHPVNDSAKISKEKLMFRPFTEDTKILIVMYMNEGRHTLWQIAQELNRDMNDMEDKIKAMLLGDEFHKIHLDLMEYDGGYAKKKRVTGGDWS